MQVTFNTINAAKKEVVINVEAERVQKSYKQYVAKSARELSVPGFRQGKAPISMVERSYGPKLKEYFEKDFVDEVFTEAAKEHDIHYLLYPQVKDSKWEEDGSITLLVDIEVEPEITFTQIENLRVPYNPIPLKDEIDKYIEDLRQENAILIDVEDAIRAGDEVEFEMTCQCAESQTKNLVLTVQDNDTPASLKEAIGKKIGDSFSQAMPHEFMHENFDEAAHCCEEHETELSFMVNAVRRKQVPELNDDFAKDLEFDNLEAMYAQIEKDISVQNEHKNQNVRINSLISKLYVDNRFDLPENTIAYVVQKELDRYNITDPQWKKFYEMQMRYSVVQDFINMYLLNALRKEYNLTPTQEEIDNYISHEAILADQSPEEWREKHKAEVENEEFVNTVANFTILNKIAATCEFFVPEPEQPTEPTVTDAEVTEVDIGTDSAE